MSTMSDEKLDQSLRALAAAANCDKHFYTKVAGATHANADGSSRCRVIGRCVFGEALELRHEPENPVDPNAIGVLMRETGDQIGFLQADLASEVASDFQQYGPCWLAVFCHPNHHPETGAVVGAVIYVMRLPVEELTESETES